MLEGTRDLLDPRADLCQLIADLVDGALGLFGELAHFISDDSKAAPMLSGTCRLDGSIKCEQVRLLCDTVDRDDEVIDTRCAFMECLYIMRHLRESILSRIRLLGDLVDACLREVHRFLADACLICGLGDGFREMYDVVCHRGYDVNQLLDVRLDHAVPARQFVELNRGVYRLGD